MSKIVADIKEICRKGDEELLQEKLEKEEPSEEERRKIKLKLFFRKLRDKNKPIIH